MRARSVFALSLLLVACGGQVDSTSSVSEQNPQQQNPRTHLPIGTVVGSFDVTFTTVTATAMFSGTYNPQVTPPSQGQSARLDFGSDAATTATLTPRWGAPTTLGAVVTSSNLALSAGKDNVTSANFESSQSGFYVSDQWSDITFGRTSDGGFDGTFTAKGSESMFQGDVGYEATLTAAGTIAGDTTAPELRAEALPPDGLLPWDPMHVQFAEPPAIAQQDILSLPQGAVTGNDTTLAAQVLSTSWDVHSSAVAAKAFVDLAGNSSKATSLPVTYVNVGAPKAAFTFDDTSSPVAFYGSSSGLITTLASDPSCESGGCLKIGTVSTFQCNTKNSGFAGILQQISGHANTLHVRYRFFVGVDSSVSSTTAIQSDDHTLTVETATPGVLPAFKSIGFATADLKTVPATFGFTQATDWATLDTPIASDSQAGFAIQFGNPTCGGGPIQNQNAYVILIDAITID